jgi:bisanhydrobacterioruberin hydratase
MKQRFAILFLAVTYLAGVVGIAWPVHPDFVLLTPLSLLLSLGLALYFHPRWSPAMAWFLPLCYAVGFGAELFGVQTGLLFGDYAYGRVLGPKVWETPLMIGVNWILVSYTAGMAINAVAPGWRWPLRALAGSLLLVALDLFIEPVAIEYGFWSWEGGVPPLRNYLGWFAVALPLQAWFARHFEGQKNNVAAMLFIYQFLFFLVLSLW